MQRQRGEVVPIGDALVPVKSIRDATPQALHHFTQADQVNALVTAREEDPDLGFMARLMARCAACHAPIILATGKNTSASTAPTRSS